MADTAAALVIQLTAETRAFQREIRKATGVFDAEGRKIEKRQQQLRKNFEQGFGRFTAGFLSTAAVVGFGRHVLATADALSDAAQQLGVTTQELQGLDYAARVSGASSEKLTQALSFLADGLGEAQRGEGAMAEAMRRSGIQMGTTLEVLFDVAERVKAATTETEKMNIATTYLGTKGGKTMVSFLNQGAEGLRKLREEASAKGQVWDQATVARLDAAKDSFETMQKALVNIAALPTSEFLNDVAGLLDALGSGNWEAALKKLAELLPVIAGVGVGGAIGGLPGAVVGGGIGLAASSALSGPTPIKPYSGPFNFGGGGRRSSVPQSSADAARAAAEALRATREIQQMISDVSEDARRAGDEAGESLRNVVREQNAALLARAQGWSEFADIQREVVESGANLDIASIEARKDADLRALEARRAADLERLSELNGSAAQAAQIEQQYADQREAIERTTATEITAIRARLSGDLAQIQTNGIKLGDGVRDSMVDIGTAALHGFGSMKDAAAAALEQIAQMILQMYVLKPLVESIMGPAGTSGGGFLGSLLSGIPGFANGIRSAPGGLAVVGERGPELVNLPRGAQVIPHIPQIMKAGGSGQVVQHFDMRGAIVTDDIMRQARQAGAAASGAQLASYDRNILPGRVATLRQNPRLR